MLQQRYRYMSISALALAALGLAANADQGCDLSDGLALQPAAFQSETVACLETAKGVEADIYMQNELSRLTDAVRTSQGTDGLKTLKSLNEAARIHAFDMATRDYIAHSDPEGRGHLDRVRLLERTHLIGAFGANMAVISDFATASEAFDALKSDPVNADNMARAEFDHMGIAAVRANGRIYVVQLFSGVEGRRDTPLPSHISSHNYRAAKYAAARF